MRTVVLLRGSVEGMGRTARCEMLAMKEYLSPTSPPIYSRCCILDAPEDLPDGEYQVTFAGHRVSAHKEVGLWLPSDDAVPMQSEARRERKAERARDTLPPLLHLHGRRSA